MKPNLVSIRTALLIGGLLSTAGSSAVHADQGGIRAQVAALQQAVQMLQQQVGTLVDQAKANNTAITQLTAVELTEPADRPAAPAESEGANNARMHVQDR